MKFSKIIIGTIFISVCLIIFVISIVIVNHPNDKALRTAIATLNKNCPYQLVDLTIESAELNDDEVVYRETINEDFIKIMYMPIEKVKNYALYNMTLLPNQGNEHNFAKMVLESGKRIHIFFTGSKTGVTKEIVITSNELQKCIEGQEIPIEYMEELLEQMVRVINSQLPMTVTNWWICKQFLLEKDTATYLYEIDNFSRLPQYDVMKEQSIHSIRETCKKDETFYKLVSLLVGTGRSLRHHYICSSTGETIDVTFLNSELKEIINSLK